VPGQEAGVTTIGRGGPRLKPIIRACVEEDLPAVQAVYSHYVLGSVATFETVPPTLGDWQRKMAEIEAVGLPFLVATIDARVAGYAYCSRWRPRPAYRFTVEDSIYVAPEYLGRGIGSVLLPALLEECAAVGARQCVAVIAVGETAPSLGLHARFGFREAGRLTAVGYKFDRWLDTVLMQRTIGPGAGSTYSDGSS
jgi:L-amino acid N-acyltransferase YncA